jgi:4-hydroxy-2-oxoheptanedioate aldolase
MTGREIREALHEGRRVYATAAIAPSTYWPGMLRQAGIDFVFLDTEHVPLGRETLSWMCRAYAALGIPPVVRVPSPDAFEAAKVLDGGAGGVIGPYVETADQVRALVGSARYRPLKGRRLQDALRNPDSLEPELREYLEARNADTILIVNIESVPAIENLDEILRVPGLDAVLIGPHDLSCSLGIPEQYRHPRFDEAVRTIFRKAREHHVGAGIHFWEGIDQEIEWSRAGGNLIMHSSDLALFSQSLKRDLAQIRSALGDSPVPPDSRDKATV